MPTWDSPGIFVSSYAWDGSEADSYANIHDNEIYDCDSGIIVGSYFSATDNSSATIIDNNFHDLNWAVNFEKGTISVTDLTGNKFSRVNKAVNSDDGNGGPAEKPTVIAEENYWGTAVLGTIQGLVYEGVDFSPYYIDGAMTILNNEPINMVYVDDNYSDGSADGHYFGYDAFATIQEGIDRVATANGIVNVAAGAYSGDVNVNKPLTLQGVSGANLTGKITITSNSVTVDGLDITNPTAGYGIVATDYSDLRIANNTIHEIGTALASGSAQAIYVKGYSVAINNISILGNHISNVGNTNLVYAGSGGAKGIFVGDSNGTKDISGVIINDNVITGIYDSTAAYPVGRGAYGIIINHSTGVAATRNLTISGNVISALEGYWAHAIGLEGNTPDAAITGNTISNLIEHGTMHDAIGVFFEDNRSAGTTSVHDNKFDLNTVYFNMAAHPTTAIGTVDAARNWWGTTDGMIIASKTFGNVNYRPWRVSDDLNLSVDETRPTAAISSSITNLSTNISPIPFAVAFNESVTGFEASDITVDNGVITDGSFSGTGMNYSFTVTPNVDFNGLITVNVAVEKAWDDAGNYNTAAAQFEIIYDNVSPTATVEYSTTELMNQNVVATMTADEAVTVTSEGGLFSHEFTGNGVFTFSFIDAAGNQGSVTATVGNIDKEIPSTPVITSISGNNFINNNKKSEIVITGTAEANSLVSATLNDGTHQVSGNQQLMDNNANFSITLNGSSLSDGIITPSVTATDAAGNISGPATTPAATKDIITPIVTDSSLSPAKNAVGVALDATISLAFSEKVNIGNVVIKNNTTGTETTILSNGISFNDISNAATVSLPIGTLQSNTVYTVKVNNIQDESGNNIVSYGSDDSWQFTTATGYTINLTSGWNLISLPVTPTTWRSISDTLDSVSGKVNRIWTYDAPNEKWLVYNSDPSVPSDANFTSLEAGRGYWVEMNAGGSLVGSGTLYEQLVPSGGQPSGQLPQVQLAEGWNMIGYYQLPGKTTAPIVNALSKLSGAWSGEGNDVITFTSNTLQPQTPILTMTPGEGYWIFMNNAKKYSFGNGNF
jgi:hypothetical protein